jgi:DNA repair protein RadD
MPGLQSSSVSRPEQEKAAEILTRRLSAADFRSVLRNLSQGHNRGKSVERIVAEVENSARLGRLLNTRIEDASLAEFLVDITGLDLFADRKLRYLLALRSSEAELDALHEFPGGTRARGVSPESLARCVAERNWHPGKRWARHFVEVLGFPQAFSGLPGIPSSPNFEDVEPHVPLPKLEDFQEDLRLQVVELLRATPGSNRAVLTLPTGAGKTRTTVEALVDWWLADREGEFILWIAQSEELCEQAVQAFREVWIDRGDRGVREPIRLYRFWGARRPLPDEDYGAVVIATIDKLRSVLVESETGELGASMLRISSNLGAIIIDEAHRAEAPSYRKVLESLGVEFASGARSPVPILGLTATPLRSQHEETIRLARRFYNCLLKPRNLSPDPATMIEELRNRGVLSKPSHRVLVRPNKPIRLSKKQEDYLQEWNEFDPELLTELGQARDRNRQILDAIAALEPDWPVLFFGCSVQHAEAMAVLLRRHGRDAAAVTAETRDATRRYLVESFRRGQVKILCNYGVLTTGFDAPQVRAVVVGRPTNSRLLYEQMIGRGMRGPSFGGTSECLVLDVHDNLVHLDGRQLTTASQKYAEYWVKDNATKEEGGGSDQ